MFLTIDYHHHDIDLDMAVVTKRRTSVVSLEVSTKRRKLLLSSAEERNWSDLFPDLLILVVNKIDSVRDYFAFRAVCSQWRCAAAYEDFYNIRRQPWLLEATKEGCDFSNPFDSPAVSRSVETILPEEIHDVAGCRGWLLVVHEDRIMELVHIMSGTRIRLPCHERSYIFGIDRIVLSSSPLTNSSDYTLMIAYYIGHTAFWRPGDETFTEINQSLVCDITCYNGFFYGVNSLGRFMQIKGCTSHPTAVKKGLCYLLPLSLLFPEAGHILYLAECDGDLLLVIRFKGQVEIRSQKKSRVLRFKERVEWSFIEQRNGGENTHFRVFKIEEPDGSRPRVKEMESLGNRALFVGGFNASFSVKASEIPGCKPNHIYFTGHRRRHLFRDEGYRYREKHHMGVYSLRDGLVVESSVCEVTGCTCCCPPLWVTPTLV